MLQKIYKLAKLGAVLCVIPVTVFLCLFLNELRNTTKTLGIVTNNLPKQVDTRIDKLQADVLNKIDTVQDKTNTEITTLAKITDNRLNSIQHDVQGDYTDLLNDADYRLLSIQLDLFNSVKDIRTDLNSQLTTANNSVSLLATSYATVPVKAEDYFNRNLNQYLDCSENSLCIPSQASDTLFAFKTAARTFPDISKNLDTTTKNIGAVTTDFRKLVDNWTKPSPWYKKLYSTTITLGTAGLRGGVF